MVLLFKNVHELQFFFHEFSSFLKSRWNDTLFRKESWELDWKIWFFLYWIRFFLYNKWILSNDWRHMNFVNFNFQFFQFVIKEIAQLLSIPFENRQYAQKLIIIITKPATGCSNSVFSLTEETSPISIGTKHVEISGESLIAQTLSSELTWIWQCTSEVYVHSTYTECVNISIELHRAELNWFIYDDAWWYSRHSICLQLLIKLWR